MTPKFENADKSLTAYALACGYVEIWTFPRGIRPAEANLSIRLERLAGCRAYVVRSNGRYLRRWDYNGPSLTEARRTMRKLHKFLGRDEKNARDEALGFTNGY